MRVHQRIVANGRGHLQAWDLCTPDGATRRYFVLTNLWAHDHRNLSSDAELVCVSDSEDAHLYSEMDAVAARLELSVTGDDVYELVYQLNMDHFESEGRLAGT